MQSYWMQKAEKNYLLFSRGGKIQHRQNPVLDLALKCCPKCKLVFYKTERVIYKSAVFNFVEHKCHPDPGNKDI